MMCILLSASVCSYTECNNIHRASNIKFAISEGLTAKLLKIQAFLYVMLLCWQLNNA